MELSEVITEPDLAEPYTVRRSTGQFVAGGWEESRTELPFYGIVSVLEPSELDQVPEGDRVHGMRSFHATQPIHLTRGMDENPGTSDIIVWQTTEWRVLAVLNYSNRGYYKALAARMSGN